MKKVISVFLIFMVSSILIFSQQLDMLLKDANNLLFSQKYKEAIEILLKAQKIAPDNQYVSYNLTLCYIYTGRMDLAAINIDKFINKNKMSAEAYNLKGIICENINQPDSAMFYYNKTIGLEKDFYEAYFGKGRVYFSQGKHELALENFLKANKGNLLNPLLTSYIGKTYYHLGKYEEAVKELKNVVKNTKDDWQLFQYLGNSYYMLKKYKEAETNYSEVLKLNPNMVEALNNRAICYTKMEMSDEAEADYAKIKQINDETAIQPNSIQFKEIKPSNGYFYFEVPSDWRAFSRDNNDTTIIVFFDTQQHYEMVSGTEIKYSCGGEFKIIHNAYLDTSKAEKNMDRRLEIEGNYTKEESEKTAKYLNYKLLFKKMLSTTDKLKRGYSNIRYKEDINSEEKFAYEYYAATTSGNLVLMNLWVNVENGIKYNLIFEYILKSININE